MYLDVDLISEVTMNNGGVGLKPEDEKQQQQQRGGRPPQYLDEVLHPTAPHPRFAKNVYIELAAFSDSIYERGKVSRVLRASNSIQYHRQRLQLLI